MGRKITRWVIIISGYLQSEGRPSGMTRLWQGVQSSAEQGTAVLLLRWNDSAADWANLIWATSQEQRVKSPKIVIAGYSWGGQTAINLARHLDKKGLGVADLILSDAVYRFPLLCLAKRLLAFMPWWSLTIPANVKRCVWFYQKRNRPRGHTVIAKDPSKTLVWPKHGHEINVIHQYMDDSLAFHEEVQRCAA